MIDHGDFIKLLIEKSSQTEKALIELIPRERLVLAFFKNAHKKNGKYRGGRLTDFGHTLAIKCFHAYTVEPEEIPTHHTTIAMIHLDSIAQLPYHISSSGTVTVFEPDLAIQIQILMGDISRL